MNRLNLIKQRLIPVVCFGLVASLMFPTTAHAYVDPGSGSVIVTTILGLIAAVGYTFRKYFYKLRGMFRREDPNDKK